MGVNISNTRGGCKVVRQTKQNFKQMPYMLHGFTLVEMVVAASVFAIISVASFAAISNVLDAREAINEKHVVISSLQRTHALLKNDMRYALNRSVRDELGETENPLLINENNELFRLTTLYPSANQKGKLKRVTWELKDNALWRNEFSVLDRAPETQKTQRKVAGDIEQITVSYYSLEDGEVEKKSEWDSDDSLPIAFEVELELENKQVYLWLFGGAQL